jgi:hypothetical protein
MKLVAVALVLSVGACAGPLDEPVTDDQSALAAGDPAVTGLPGCDGVDLSGPGIDVILVDDGTFVTSAGGSFLCHDDGSALLTAGVASSALAACVHTGRSASTTDGTPLPANHGETTSDGTPLPARR